MITGRAGRQLGTGNPYLSPVGLHLLHVYAQRWRKRGALGKRTPRPAAKGTHYALNMAQLGPGCFLRPSRGSPVCDLNHSGGLTAARAHIWTINRRADTVCHGNAADLDTWIHDPMCSIHLVKGRCKSRVEVIPCRRLFLEGI